MKAKIVKVIRNQTSGIVVEFDNNGLEMGDNITHGRDQFYIRSRERKNVYNISYVLKEEDHGIPNTTSLRQGNEFTKSETSIRKI